MGSDFLTAFFRPEDDIYIFGITPKDAPEPDKPQKLKTNLKQFNTDAFQRVLKNLNQTKGIYFTVNSGGTKKGEITRINAMFCEIDDLPIQAQHDIYEAAWWPPCIRVITKKSVHAYWLPSGNLEVADFEVIQAGLIEHFKSDPALLNPNRLMRMPGFDHLSFDGDAMVRTPVTVHTFNPRFKFTKEEMLDAFGAIAMKEYPPEMELVFEEMRDRLRMVEGYHDEGGGYSSARGICHNGETNRTLVVNHTTGQIFCRSGCDFHTIREVLGVQLPKFDSRTKTVFESTKREEQSSDLFQALKRRQNG